MLYTTAQLRVMPSSEDRMLFYNFVLCARGNHLWLNLRRRDQCCSPRVSWVIMWRRLRTTETWVFTLTTEMTPRLITRMVWGSWGHSICGGRCWRCSASLWWPVLFCSVVCWGSSTAASHTNRLIKGGLDLRLPADRRSCHVDEDTELLSLKDNPDCPFHHILDR